MKKVLSIAAVTLVFFLIGSVATYVTIPKIFPDKAAPADSLVAVTDSVGIDPIRVLAGGTDSLYTALIDSLLTGNPDSTNADLVRALPHLLSNLRDSIAAVERSKMALLAERDALRAERDSVVARVGKLQARLSEAIIPEGDAAELSKTLAGMDDKKLRPILERVSDNALLALYHTSSPRDRRTILAAMPPDRAVRLVQGQLAANEHPIPTSSAAADSAAIQ